MSTNYKQRNKVWNCENRFQQTQSCEFGQYCCASEDDSEANRSDTVWAFRLFKLCSIPAMYLVRLISFSACFSPSCILRHRGSCHSNRPTTLFLQHTYYWCKQHSKRLIYAPQGKKKYIDLYILNSANVTALNSHVSFVLELTIFDRWTIKS